MRESRGSLYLLVALVTWGCGTGPEQELLAVIEAEVLPVTVFAPQTASAGVEVEVSVATLQRRGCEERGRTEVVVTGMRATVTPYTVVPSPAPANCTDALLEITRRVLVKFDTPGLGTVTFRGRSLVRNGVGQIAVTAEVLVE